MVEEGGGEGGRGTEVRRAGEERKDRVGQRREWQEKGGLIIVKRAGNRLKGREVTMEGRP